jgi:nitroimidazol reductase NimA-like FMN-containing flavoprotein (pyridoxamine 5'-phosphate oxidase superfamily)
MAVTTMTREEREAFLAGVHVGVLSIADGASAPLTVPIWYDYTPGGEVRLVTGRASRKGKRLVPGAYVSLCAQQEAPPYKYVSVEGVVVTVDAADIERDVRPLARRYLGENGGDLYVASTRDMYVDEANVVVRIRVERWLSVDYAKEWSAKP